MESAESSAGKYWKEQTMRDDHYVDDHFVPGETEAPKDHPGRGIFETLVRAVLAVFLVALGIVGIAFVFTVLASLTG